MLRHLSKLDSVVTGNQQFLLSTTQSFSVPQIPFKPWLGITVFWPFLRQKASVEFPDHLTSLPCPGRAQAEIMDRSGASLTSLNTKRTPSSSADLLYVCPEFCLTFIISSKCSVSFLFQLPFCSHLHVSSSFRVFLRFSLNWYFPSQISPPVLSQNSKLLTSQEICQLVKFHMDSFNLATIEWL